MHGKDKVQVLICEQVRIQEIMNWSKIDHLSTNMTIARINSSIHTTKVSARL